MPPSVALTVCTAFVALLLWIDRKQSLKVSISMWVPTFWMMYCSCSRSITSWFSTAQQLDINYDLESGNAIDRTILSIIIILGVLLLIKRKPNWSQIFKDNKWLILMFIFMLISILWSGYPLVSFKRWIKTAGTVIMAIAVLTESAPLSALQAVLRRTIYILIPFSITLIKYYPRLGVAFGRWSGLPSWIGTTVSKNSLGALCMVSAFFLIWSLVKKEDQQNNNQPFLITSANLLVLGISIWLLWGGGGYSATSILVLICGFACMLFLRTYRELPIRFGFIVLCGIAIIFLLYWIMNNIFGTSPIALVASLVGRDATLTGRTDMIWKELIPIAMQNPALGVGYGAFWLDPVFEFEMKINEAHNGYLDVFIELGAVGLIFLAMLIVSYFHKAVDDFKYNREWSIMRFSFLLIVLMHNVTETSYLRSTLLLWNLLVFLMVIFPQRNLKDVV